MGIGMVLITKSDEETLKAVRESLAASGEDALLIGRVIPLDAGKDTEQVKLLNIEHLSNSL